MNIHHIKKQNIIPNIWDGGKTFEYFIFPTNSIFNQQNFTFRISNATIEKTPSKFTRFKGFKRYLVMLDHHLHISNNNKEETYEPFEIFSFNSDNEIISFSEGNDFNLITSNQVIQPEVTFGFANGSSNKSWIILFAIHQTELLIQEDKILLEPYDCLVIDNHLNQKVYYSSDKNVLISNFSLSK